MKVSLQTHICVTRPQRDLQYQYMYNLYNCSIDNVAILRLNQCLGCILRFVYVWFTSIRFLSLIPVEMLLMSVMLRQVYYCCNLTCNITDGNVAILIFSSLLTACCVANYKKCVDIMSFPFHRLFIYIKKAHMCEISITCTDGKGNMIQILCYTISSLLFIKKISFIGKCIQLLLTCITATICINHKIAWYITRAASWDSNRRKWVFSAVNGGIWTPLHICWWRSLQRPLNQLTANKLFFINHQNILPLTPTC